jgi:hypothetical protein
VICFAGRVPKFRVENFFFGGGGGGRSLALTNFGTLQTNAERSGPCDERHDSHDWEARVTSERVRVSEGPSSIRARTTPATDICAGSIVERNMSKCFPFVMLRSGLTEIRTQSSCRLRAPGRRGTEVCYGDA